MTQYSELQLLKLLTTKAYKRHIYVQSPWKLDEYKPLDGYYLNPNDNNSVYFHSDDKVGLSVSKHFNCLKVKDYLGRYRSFVIKYYLDSSLTKCLYESRFLRENSFSGNALNNYAYMEVQPGDAMPGDFYIEDESSGFIPILSIQDGEPQVLDILNSWPINDGDDVVERVTGIGSFQEMIYALITL